MEIIEKTYAGVGNTAVRSKTTRIILHHAASSIASADDIQRWHTAPSTGYSCIGYHFLVRKNGNIYRGRPQNRVGAHALSNNADSIGICFEGNFENESMTVAQVQAGKELVAYLKGYYGIYKVQKHSDVNATACPGRNFPFSEIAQVVASSGSDGNARPAPIEVGYQPYPGTLIKKGSKGDAVRAIQQVLKNENCPGDIVVDGDFGSITLNGVRMYQDYYGLAVDGIVGKDTWSHMFGVEKPANNSFSTPPIGYPGLLKVGSKGLAVTRAQQIFKAENCLVGGLVDGIFGINTEKSVKMYQDFYGLAIDGIIGIDTYTHMNNKHGF